MYIINCNQQHIEYFKIILNINWKSVLSEMTDTFLCYYNFINILNYIVNKKYPLIKKNPK